MLQCQICQHENPEGAEYCENCGAALAASPSPAASASAPQPEQAPGAAPAPDVLPDPAEDGSIPADQPAPEVTAPSPESEPVEPPSATGKQTAPLTGDEPAPSDESPDAPVQSGEPPAAPTSSTSPTLDTPPSTGQGDNPRLVAVRHGAPSGQEFQLFGKRLVVGRFDPETGPVDIDLSDTPEAVQISRHHAEIFNEGDAWQVRDLGSTNGVFVKSPDSATFGPRISEPRSLSNGDEVAFGNARFVFQMD